MSERQDIRLTVNGETVAETVEPRMTLVDFLRETRIGFAELARRHGDYAMVGLAAAARADGAKLNDLRLAFFGVGATPVRARNAEAALAAGDLEAAVAALAHDLDPPDDVQAEGRVKKHLAGALLRRVAHQLGEAIA